MKQSYHRHGAWALVTFSAWAAGSLRHESPHFNSGRAILAEETQKKQADSHRPPQPSSDGNQSDDSSSRTFRTDEGRDGTVRETPKPTERQLADWAQASITAGTPIKRRLAFDRILKELSSLGPSQIIALRSTLHQLGANDELRKLFDYAWASKSPDSALAFLDQVPDELRQNFLANMLPGLASSDPVTAISLFESLGQDLQNELRPNLYKGLIDHDEAVATNYVLDSANPDRPDWRPMDTFTRELVSNQGIKATLNWAQTLPQGSLRGNAWSAAFARWTTENPVAVAETLQDMPVSGDRDQAINGFISALAGQDPKTAVTWAAEINQSGLREAAMIRAGKRYFHQNPAAANDWFASSGLPPNVLSIMKPTE